MEKIFRSLLRNYALTEEHRFEIYKILHEKVIKEYKDQSPIGNIFNGFVEFIMTQPTINEFVKNDDKESIELIKKELIKYFDKSIGYIKNERI